MNHCAVNLFQAKGHAFHPSLYPWQWPWMVPNVQLPADMWGTADARSSISGSRHVSEFTQVGGLNRSSDGCDNLKGCRFGNKQATSPFIQHPSGCVQLQTSHLDHTPVPYPRNGLKKTLLGLKPDGFVFPQDHQLQGRNNVHDSPTSTIPRQNGYILTDYPANKSLSHRNLQLEPSSHLEPNSHQLRPDSLPYILPVHNPTLRGVALPQPPAATPVEPPTRKDCRCRPQRGQTPPKGYICHLCFTDGHHYIYDCPKVQL